MTFNIGSLKGIKIPRVSVGGIAPHGEVFIRRLSLQGGVDIAKLDDRGLSASELVSALITAMLRKADETALTSDEVRALTSVDRQRIVNDIIKHNADWFFEDRNVAGEGTDLAKLHAPMQRQESETDEEFLARGIRSEIARNKAHITSMLSGFSKQMKSALAPNLTANMGASQLVADIVKSMNERRPSALDHATLKPAVFDFRAPEIQRSPIFDTNEILTEVADQIGEMRDLAAATAEMQRTLNDTASTAVADFSKGAESTRIATRNGLWIAGASLLVSVIALGASIYASNSQSAEASLREAAARTQAEKSIAAERELSERIRVLTANLVEARATVFDRQTAKTSTAPSRKK